MRLMREHRNTSLSHRHVGMTFESGFLFTWISFFFTNLINGTISCASSSFDSSGTLNRRWVVEVWRHQTDDVMISHQTKFKWCTYGSCRIFWTNLCQNDPNSAARLDACEDPCRYHWDDFCWWFQLVDNCERKVSSRLTKKFNNKRKFYHRE